MQNITLKNVIAGYVGNVFEPVAYGNEKPKHKMKVVVSKDDPQCRDLLGAVKAAAKEKFSSPLPSEFINPVHDGDKETTYSPLERNTYYFWAKSNQMPDVIDDNGRRVTEESGKLQINTHVDVDVAFNAYNWVDRREGPLAGVTVYLNKIIVHEDEQEERSDRNNAHSGQQTRYSNRDVSRREYNVRRTEEDALPDPFPLQLDDDDFDLLNL